MKLNQVEIGERIKIVRGEQSGKKFGDLIGVSTNMVSMYETGTAWPKPQTLFKIIEISGRSSDWLLFGKDDPEPIIISEPSQEYSLPTAEEEELLKLIEETPDAREALEVMIALPPRKRKIYLGKMLEDLEKIEEEGKS